MTDLKKLRELAEKATPTISYADNAPYWEYILAANPQAIIELLDRLERYEKALEHYESAHYTISGFPCDHDGVAREALEGGK